MKKIYLLAILLMASVVGIHAANVEVTMNTLSTTMTLQNKATEAMVAVGEPTNRVYTFTADNGTYILTGIATDGTTVNGTIELTIEGDTAFVIQTVTAYATNKVDNVSFVYGEDYTIVPNLIDPNGNPSVVTIGNSTTAGRQTFLAVKGSTTNVELVPTEKRAAERFATYYDTKNRAINGNATIGASLPTWKPTVVAVPATANFQFAQKVMHYVAFAAVEPNAKEVKDGVAYYTVNSNLNQVYAYRAWEAGKLTQAGKFTVNAALDTIYITEEDMNALSPKYVQKEIAESPGGNQANILLNINEQGHLKMQVGDTKNLLAQRTWQLTDNQTNNYYIEPDYHYTVLNLEGKEDNSVVSLERYDTNTDAWTTMTAVGKGTAIVLVTYDAIRINQYTSAAKTPYMFGPDFGAVWPENTGVFVVTVGDEATGITPNMTIFAGENAEKDKLAVDKVDAESDVFYYLENKGYAEYTFKPEGVKKVAIYYPTFGANIASYSTTEEVAANEDGSYTLRLKEGRQIVAMYNEAGVAEYQVLTAKPCNVSVSNLSRPGKNVRPGDVAGVQFSGLKHIANKLAGIYNMCTYIEYGGVANGTAQFGGSNQYTFDGTPAAQLYKYTLPVEAEVEGDELVLEGMRLKFYGNGDALGNHRNTDRAVGRQANLAASSHTVYTSALPAVTIPVEDLQRHIIDFKDVPAAARIIVMNEQGDTLKTNADGYYAVRFGAFTYSIEAEGYAPLHSAFTVSLSQNETIYVRPQMTTAALAWDGTTTTEPQQVEGVYQITTPAELAWLAATVNASTEVIDAVLTADLNLGGKAWTSIGTSSNPYLGTFDGQNHTISGFYMAATATYQSLFGKLKDGVIKNLTVEGYVTSTTTHAAGIVGGVEAGNLDNLHFRGTVNTAKANTAGIAGFVYGANSVVENCSTEGRIYGLTATGGIAGTVNIATDTVRNCYNRAFVSGTGTVGGIVGTSNANTVIENVYNAGNLEMRGTITWGSMSYATTIGAISGLTNYTKLENGFAATAYNNDTKHETVILGADAMADGTLAHTMGLGQEIGVDPYPVLDGTKVYELTINEQANTTVEYVNETVLPDTVWIKNIYGAYFNAEGEKVVKVESDTVVNLMIDVKPLTGAATFEERTLYPESAWYGDPEFVDDENYWNSGDYIFSTYIDNWGTSGIYYYDITMANLTGKTFSWANPYYDQYSAAGGAAEGKNYAVWYSNWYGNEPIQFAEPQTVSGMAITNNAWVVDAIRNGDGITEGGFGEGDFVKVTITGYLDEKETKSIDYYLADFRDNNETYDWTYAENWQWVDLTELGEVDAVGFSMSSSRYDTYGMTTPAYFCFDNFAGKQEDCRLGELTHITGTKHYTVTYIEQGQDTVVIDTVYTELGEKWFDNLLGWYHNENGDTVKVINSDTTLYASVALRPLTGAATFEERTLTAESAWYGDPDFTVGANTWTSGDYRFQTYKDDWGEYGLYYYDVTIANYTNKTFSWANPDYDQYSAVGGAAEGENYAVWSNNYYNGVSVTLAEPAVVSGMAVTNNAWDIEAILNGDGMSAEEDGQTGLPFGLGDYLLLTVTGMNAAGDTVGTVNYYLADFRDDAAEYDWTYAENWQWVDLTELGEVSALGFSMSSTKGNDYGMTTPAYFCFDNLGGKAEDCRLGELTHIKGVVEGLPTIGGVTDKARKVLHRGQMYIILPDGTIYNALGAQMK